MDKTTGYKCPKCGRFTKTTSWLTKRNPTGLHYQYITRYFEVEFYCKKCQAYNKLWFTEIE